MKWVDYRESLGIGFNTPQKNEMLKNRLHDLCVVLEDKRGRGDRTPSHYFVMVSEYSYHPSFFDIFDSINKEVTWEGIISKAVALVNSMPAGGPYHLFAKTYLITALDDLRLPYEIRTDEDGIYIYPKGAEELDNALVSGPLEWMSNYPKGRKAFENALRAYSDQQKRDASEISDLIRKALETFFKEFFNSEKSLNNMKSEYGNYLQCHGIPKELSNDFQTLLQQYCRYNDEHAKHGDDASDKALEYILYSTGNTIRLLISLRNNGGEY